jgi:MFS family permease
MQYIRGMSPQEAGFILLLQPLFQAAFSPIAGRLSDKVEAKKIVSLGIIITLIGIVPLIFLNSYYPVFLIGIALGIIGIGTSFFSSPNIRAIMSAIPKDSLGIAAALEGTMRTIGQAFSFGILTIVFAIIIGDVVITPIYYPQFIASALVICVIFSVLILISLIFSLLRGNQKRESKES